MERDEVSVDKAVEEFRRQAAPLVALSDRAALRKLYSRFVVYVRARNRDYELEATAAMRKALAQVLREPGSEVERGWFDGL